MSVRAYRVVKIVQDDEPTFNLWHDEKIMELLDVTSLEGLTENGGLIELEEEKIEEALATPNLDKKTEETLKKMLVQANEDGGYVKYYCF